MDAGTTRQAIVRRGRYRPARERRGRSWRSSCLTRGWD